jgi:hypothetical protein
MTMSEETKARVKKTWGLCDEYLEVIKDAFDDDGHFLWDNDCEEPYKARRMKVEQHTSEQDNV